MLRAQSPLHIRRWRLTVATALLATALSVSIAKSQGNCEPRWLPTLGTGAGYQDVNATLFADIDGPGGDGKVIVVGQSDGVIVRRGTVWSRLGDRSNGPVNALAVYDPDADGPVPPQLVAAGNFTSIDGTSVQRIARWDGQSWTPLGGGISGVVWSLAAYDPDESGPLSARLYAGGSLNSVGGTPVLGIAQWDGSVWSPVAGGVGGSVYAMTTLAAGVHGSQRARLIAAGSFTTANGSPASRIATWDGEAWASLSGGGTNSSITSLATYDPDGIGPLPLRVVAGGIFTTAGGSAASKIAQWDGAVWSALGSGRVRDVYAVAAHDPDNDGPLLPHVFAGGDSLSGSGVAMWDGSSWSNVGTGTNEDVYALGSYDLDDEGPLPTSLIAGGVFTAAGNVRVNRLALWNGQAWEPMDNAIGERVYALTTYDPDGNGPLPAQLVAGGNFNFAAGVTLNKIGMWNGTSWMPFNQGFSGHISALATHDTDGGGPLPADLIAGGTFISAVGGATLNRVGRWDGSAWAPMGNGLAGSVRALLSYDPDSSGPLNRQLVAAGLFHNSEGRGPSVARWNGSDWVAVGGEIGGAVNAIAAFDPDGNGSAQPLLVAGGNFTAVDGVAVNRIACWNGSAWVQLGSGLGSDTAQSVRALAVYDPDGTGSLPAQLIAAGYFETAGSTLVRNIARWDGSTWLPLGAGMNSSIDALVVYDQDAGGPLPALLVAGGFFTSAGGVEAWRVAAWDGSTWRALDGGLRGALSAEALTTYTPDASRPSNVHLVAAGGFTSAANYATPFIAALGCDVPTGPSPCGPADIGSTGAVPGADGLLDNNDFIVFINLFFTNVPAADVGTAGGLAGSDGYFDNNDFIAFISFFFDGC